MNFSKKTTVLIGLLALLALSSFFAFRGLRVLGDLSAFMPQETADAASGGAHQARALSMMSSSDLARSFVLRVVPKEAGVDPLRSKEKVCALAAELSSWSEVESASCGPKVEDRSLYDLLFPTRFALFASSSEDARERISNRGLDASADRLLEMLTSSESTMISNLAPSDPMLVFVSQARGAVSDSISMHIEDGAYRDNEGAFYVMGRTGEGAMGGGSNTRFVERLTRRTQQLQSQGFQVRQAGMHRFSARAEKSIRSDIEWVSTWSMVASFVLLLGVFRSWRVLLLAILPMTVGVLAGVVACRVFFGGIHGITLAFGASITGVGIDFFLHLVNHHALSGHANGDESIREVRGGLFTGAITTVLGLAGLFFAGLSGLAEMALFSSISVTTALLSTAYGLPSLLPPLKPLAMHQTIQRALLQLQQSVLIRRGMKASALVLLVASIFFLSRAKFSSDARNLAPPPADLAQEDAEVRVHLSRESSKSIWFFGSTLEAALEAQDRFCSTLSRWNEQGVATGTRSTCSLVHATSTQHQVLQTLLADSTLASRFATSFEAKGLAPESFEPFFAGLREAVEHPIYLDPQKIFESPLQTMTAGLVFRDARGYALVSRFHEIKNESQLRSDLEAFPEASLIDTSSSFGEAYAPVRMRLLWLIAAGLVLVIATCSLRYRSLVHGFFAVAPAILAAMASLALVSALGQSINLLHLAASLLVISMGEDYAVFLLEAKDNPEEGAKAAVGVLLAALTTLVSFVALASSSQVALQSLGLVVSVGIFLAALFSPLGLWIGSNRRVESPRPSPQA